MADAGWALLCEAGFWGWVIAASGFLLGSFPRPGVFQAGPALKWGCGFLLAQAVWITGMIHA
jgi:hypothetical protein